MEDKQGVNISFRGSADYRHRLHTEALARRMKVQDLLEAAVEAYLAPQLDSRTFTIRLPDEIDRAVREKLVDVDVTIPELLTQLAKMYAEGDIEVSLRGAAAVPVLDPHPNYVSIRVERELADIVSGLANVIREFGPEFARRMFLQQAAREGWKQAEAAEAERAKQQQAQAAALKKKAR